MTEKKGRAPHPGDTAQRLNLPPPPLRIDNSISATENADLTARLHALETVCAELIAERDRAVAELERVSQLSLLAVEAS